MQETPDEMINSLIASGICENPNTKKVEISLKRKAEEDVSFDSTDDEEDEEQGIKRRRIQFNINYPPYGGLLSIFRVHYSNGSSQDYRCYTKEQDFATHDTFRNSVCYCSNPFYRNIFMVPDWNNFTHSYDVYIN